MARAIWTAGGSVTLPMCRVDGAHPVESPAPGGLARACASPDPERGPDGGSPPILRGPSANGPGLGRVPGRAVGRAVTGWVHSRADTGFVIIEVPKLNDHEMARACPPAPQRAAVPSFLG